MNINDFSKLFELLEIKDSKYISRSLLVDKMRENESLKINCLSCSGRCCTLTNNSVKTTPLETLIVMQDLVSKEVFNQKLIDRIEETIADFRLRYELLADPKGTFRRTYTCPLFKYESFGCPLDYESKPYGCLGFNPSQKEVLDGEGCESNINDLEKRELLNALFEERVNQKLIKDWKLNWDKLPLPVAIIELKNAINLTL